MLKKTSKTTIYLLLMFQWLNAQTVYEFNHLLEYEVQTIEFSKSNEIINKKNYKKYILSDANDNNFRAELRWIDQKDSLSFKFTDNNNLHFSSAFSQEELEHADVYTVPQNLVIVCGFDDKNVKHYRNVIQSDTIINSTRYKRYKIEDINAKRQQRKKTSKAYYIIEPGTEHHGPIFTQEVCYEIWKSNPIFPKGIPKIKYFVDYRGNITYIETLLSVEKIHKVLYVGKFKRRNVIGRPTAYGRRIKKRFHSSPTPYLPRNTVISRCRNINY